MDCVKDGVCKKEMNVHMTVDMYKWKEKIYCTDLKYKYKNNFILQSRLHKEFPLTPPTLGKNKLINFINNEKKGEKVIIIYNNNNLWDTIYLK